MRDLTERKRLEAALVQPQKLEVVGRLAGGSLTTSIDRTISRDEGLVASGFSEHPLLTSSSRFRVLSKPFRPDDLLRAVREQLDAS